MEQTLRVIFKEPGEKPEWRFVDNRISALQDLVGGYIECVPWDEKHILIVNEEGKLRGMEINFRWAERYDIICGPCFWCSDDGEDFASIQDEAFMDEVAEYTKNWWQYEDEEIEIGLKLGEINEALKEIRHD